MTLNRHVLITGANGFVGRAVCERLLREGWSVTAVVRTDAGEALLPPGIQSVVRLDVGPTTDWSAALAGVGSVIHLAARVHIMDDTAADPLDAFRAVNTAGTEQLARQAAASGATRLVFFSSIKVMGENSRVPFRETDPPKPVDPYGTSKWEAELLLQRVAAKTGLEIVTIRPPLVYGPGVRANFLRLLELVARGIPLPLGSIRNRRSLVYLGNLVDAAIACLTDPRAAGQTYLVSDGEDLSSPELIRRIGASLGRVPRIFPFPVRLLLVAGSVMGKRPAVERLIGSLSVDRSKIMRELGWSPPFSVEDGLRETAEWFLSARGKKP